MASVNISELVTSTLRKRNNMFADNITNDIALLAYLKRGNRIVKVGGGRVITESLIYPENGTAKWYRDMDTFTIAAEEILDAAEFDWSQLGAFIYLTGREKIMNRSTEEAIDLVRARLEAAQATLSNMTGAALYSDGLTSNQLAGLRHLVQDVPTAAGTVGGINQVTSTWWQNAANSVAAGTLAATNIQTNMNNIWLKMKRGADKCNLISADYKTYQFYWESLQAIQRIQQAQSADAGYQELFFNGSPVLADDQAPANHMYFLNTKYLKLKCAPDRMWSPDTKRLIDNADYEVTPIWFAGQLVTSNRERQGVLFEAT
ncbi:MAG: phage major capsid protein [Desulfuromonas sp.]|nr:phage major capsid protein [Desulfuromonas sp.]